MKIVNPSVEYWPNINPTNHIARCARVCYASDKTTNNGQMINALWKNKHRSMFRHSGVYYIIPERIQIDERAYIGTTIKLVDNKYYVSTNEQCAKEYWTKRYLKYEIPAVKAFKIDEFYDNKMLRLTFCIETGIDITREFNRKSPNNIAEQSTRYVDFIKKIGIRFKRCHWMNNLTTYEWFLVKLMCKTAELFYKISRSKYGLNLPPQDARWILPLNTMSKVVYTYTIKEWEEIINMRLWDWTGVAHKDAKIVAQMLYDEITKLGFKIDNYKENESKSSSI